MSECCHHHHEHHDAAHALAEGATVLARTWSGRGTDCPGKVERIRAGLRRLAELAGEDGVILGHLKAALIWGDQVLAWSVTRCDTLDETLPQPLPAEAGEWKLTVNLLTLTPDVPVTEETLDSLFG